VWCKLIAGSGVFDRTWYLAQAPELARSRRDPILDYLRHGTRAGRSPNPLFEGDWYLAEYADVQASDANPLIHYLLHGAAEGRDPGPFFDTKWYMAQHPELAARLHAIERKAFAGALDPGRAGEAAEDASAGLESARSAASPATTNPLAHYLHDGWHRGALPFDPARLLAGMKVAVVVHLFYGDLWDEIASFLRNIPIGFDLFVSVPRENAGALAALVRRDHPQAQIIEVPNAGRDVAAFLAVLPRVLAGNYSVLCKLHSKKGRDYPAAWRDLLLRGLLANRLLVSRILHAFLCDPELVLVGAREVYLSGATQMTQNREKLEQVLRLVHPNLAIRARWGFFAGTMFWARPDFFARFAQCSDRIFSFEHDNTRNDGQLAHALERAFGALATLEGKRIGLTELAGSYPLDGMLRIVRAPGRPWEGSFVRVLKSHALRLAGELPFGPALAPYAGDAAGPPATGLQKRAQGRIGRFSIPAPLARWVARGDQRLPNPPRHSRAIIPRLRDLLINRVQARLIATSPLFDRGWYLERYPDVRDAGVDPALHYVAHGAQGYRDPGPNFDTAWYLAYYADVAAWGMNPLVHYLRYGMKEGRHTNPSQVVVGEVTDAALSCRRPPRAAGEVALFVTHSPDGRLKPHVRHYLRALRREGISPVLIVAADREFHEPDSGLTGLLDGLYVRQNVGYDFAAWAHVLRENPALLRVDILYLINDSMVGPLNQERFARLLERVRSSNSDVVGLTDSYERGWHIQSYFLALKCAALKSPALSSFIAGVKNLSEKRAVVNAYETRLAPSLQAAGLCCEALFPASRAHNPSLAEWRALIGSGLPFVKVVALRNSARGSGDGEWQTALRAEGFDVRLVEQALA
jgi:lipopolysaccharide biosynthesis protein